MIHDPSPEDIAAERIVGECAERGHHFPEPDLMHPTTSTPRANGLVANLRRDPCRPAPDPETIRRLAGGGGPRPAPRFRPRGGS